MLKVNLIQELAYIERVRATPGSTITEFLEQVRILSILLNRRFIAIHNEHEIVVEPFMSLKELIIQWDESVEKDRQMILKKANRG